jgi:poly(A) polymerase
LILKEKWKPPAFPLDGKDVMAIGLDEGPQIGVVLRDVEAWWVEQGFAPDRAGLLRRLKETIAKGRM